MYHLDNSSVLITGGTGSLGKALIEYLMKNTKVRRIAVYSRDELKQHNLRNEIGEDSRLRWFIGDIRDLDRLKRALHGVDYVIHTAALKQVDTGEYNPMEFIKTNVLGSQNVIDACIEAGVRKVVALSTDKASSPINLYGATKLTADKLFVAANNYSHSYGTTFCVVRYGNVMGSRGSVIPFWKALHAEGKPLPITDFRMTRFWISIDQASIKYLNELPEEFHPINVSLHMHDLGGDRQKLFEASGFKTVSLGETNNPSYHKKFFSLVSNYKYAFSESWGSHVPFLLKSGIPTQIVPRAITITRTGESAPVHSGKFEIEIHKVEEMFASLPNVISPEQLLYIDSLLGVRYKKSRLEVSKIVYGQLCGIGLKWILRFVMARLVFKVRQSCPKGLVN